MPYAKDIKKMDESMMTRSGVVSCAEIASMRATPLGLKPSAGVLSSAASSSGIGSTDMVSGSAVALDIVL